MAVEYDAFRAMPWQQRVEVFDALDSADKAALVKTHVRTWLDSNRSRLTEEQITVMEENIAAITPDLYDRAQRAESHRRTRELETRTARLFSRDDMRHALTMHWDQR